MYNSNHDKRKEYLIKERDRIQNLIKNMDQGIYSDELGGELSVVDNHPADIGEEMAMASTAMALRENEMKILNQIDSAIEKINSGSYGMCSSCGNEINHERLDYIPYTEYCIQCQNNLSSQYSSDMRPVEENVLSPFNYGYNDRRGDPGFDGEDAYEAVESFNSVEGIDDYYYKDNDCVEEVDRISNEYYKSQL